MKNTKIASLLFVLSAGSMMFAQDDLINKLKNNQSQNANFQFTALKDVGATSVKNQGSSGTCWSYSGNSFLESEMQRMGKKPVDLAEIFTARNSYHDKAKLYVLNSGAISWGDGGELHDVVNMYKKYGAVPQDVYTGLKSGQSLNNFKEMQGKLKPVLDSLVQAGSKGKLTDNWMDSVDSILDEYLEKFRLILPMKEKLYSKNIREGSSGN